MKTSSVPLALFFATSTIAIIISTSASSAFTPSGSARLLPRHLPYYASSAISSPTALVSTKYAGTTRSSSSSSSSSTTLPSPEESAQALTEFMAKAHEEKLRAVREAENKYKAEIASLKAKLEQYEGASPATKKGETSNSYEFPATNKEMTAKVRAYHKFLSEYLVKSQLEKVAAVEATKEKYEAIIDSMKKQKLS